VDKSIFFLSDTHFAYHNTGENESKKRSLFLEFLAHIRGADRLYLLGDIFDFWFEHGKSVPGYYDDILDGLHSLVESGTSTFITGGNHDHWLGGYFPEALGVTVLPTLVTHELQGRTITMTHGDTLLPGDYAYKALKAVIRSRPVIAIARLVHPAILYRFAGHFSVASKGMTHKKTEQAAETLLGRAGDSYFKWGNDVFIMGHVHVPILRRFEEKTFVILGDWEEHFSYLELRGGGLSLCRYNRVDPIVIEKR
jgi:UDP-2,3-diacylglucosamine hydrolase